MSVERVHMNRVRRRPPSMKRIVYVITSAFLIFVVYLIAAYYLEQVYYSVRDRTRCSQFAEHLIGFLSASSGRGWDRMKAISPQLPLPPQPHPVRLKVIDTSTVFYVWCGAKRRPFEFRNYLSVRSALRTLRPDTVWFYYESEPVVDRWLYNTWWTELIDSVPFFHRRPLRDVGGRLPERACDGPGRPSPEFLVALVASRGGTYVDEATVLVDRPPDDGMVVAVDSDRRRVFRILKSDRDVSCVLESFSRWPPTIHMCECQPDSKFVMANSSLCVHLTRSVFPKDIWALDSDLGRVLRREFYGRSDVVRPTPSFDQLAPNIGHVIWVGGGKMDFLFFLCVLSLLHVAKVDVVYVHGDQPPTGVYWDLILKTRQNVQLVLRENVGQVYGQKVADRQHVSDVWRADILLKHGGIYIDTDAVFTRPLTSEQRAYNVVASFDWIDWNPPFPDIINLGVVVSKPHSRFWQLCLESMKWFIDDDFSWNGLRQPYRVLERHRDLLHVDPRLQLICFEERCHPTWWPNYHDERVYHASPPPSQAPFDWRSDVHAVHFTYPTPPELSSPHALLHGDGFYAEIGRMILNASVMLPYFT